jgi:antitoxin component YwqK of YwqJK toxin-antitoxin module
MKIKIHKEISLFLLLIIMVYGCENQLKKEVVETFADGTPKIESFYTLAGENKEVIKEIQYYENGQKKYVGHFKKGKKDGMWTFWFENGKKSTEGYFLEGLRTGETQAYHENGKLNYKGEYLEGKKNGKWEFYNDEGMKINEITFENGKILNQSNDKVGSVE